MRLISKRMRVPSRKKPITPPREAKPVDSPTVNVPERCCTCKSSPVRNSNVVPDEEDLTPARVINSCVTAYAHGVVVYFRVANLALDRIEGVARTRHADIHGTTASGPCVFGPLDHPGEVDQKGGLQVVFGMLIGSVPVLRHTEHPRKDGKTFPAADSQCRQVTFPYTLRGTRLCSESSPSPNSAWLLFVRFWPTRLNSRDSSGRQPRRRSSHS